MEVTGGNIYGRRIGGEKMRPRIVQHWYVIPLTTLFVCAIGIPVIWFSSGEKSKTTGRIRISPVMSSILFEDADSERVLPNYENFMNTEAGRMTSLTVLNRVADDLKRKNLTLFADSPDLVEVMRGAIQKNKISIAPERQTEFLNLKMISKSPEEAEQVINAIINAYMNVVRAEEANSIDRLLSVLDEQKRTLAGKITFQTQEINRLLDEFGTGELDHRQRMILRTVEELQKDLISITLQRVALKADVQVLEKSGSIMPAADHTEQLNAYINSDPLVQALAGNIIGYEALFAEGQSQTAEGDPSLQNIKRTLEALTTRLTELKSQLTKQFESEHEVELKKSQDRALAQAKARLAHIEEHEKKLRGELDLYDTATIGMGRKQLNIEGKKAELERTRTLYNQICDRLSQIEVEQKRPARISIAEMASSVPVRSRRTEMVVGIVLVGLLLGILLAVIPWGGKARL